MGIFDGQQLDKLTYDPLNVAGDAFDLALFDFRPGAGTGTIYFKGAAGWTGLPAGTPGQFLQQGTTVPQWAAVAGGGDMLSGTYDPTGVIADAFNLANFAIPGEADGDIYIHFGGTWLRLPLGSTNQVLTALGSNIPAWQDVQGDLLASVYDPTAIAASAFDLSNFLIPGQTQGDLYLFNGVTWRRLAIGTAGRVLTSQGAGADPDWFEAPLAKGEILDLTVTFLTTSTVRIEVGECRADNNINDIRHTVVATADITASGTNGLDTGVEAASTWYDLYVIGDPAGNTASLLVVQGNVPALPGAFTRKRRVGIIRNDAGSNFINFVQTGSQRTRTYFLQESTAVTTLLSGGAAVTPTVVALGTLVPPTTQTVHLGVHQNGGPNVDIHRTTGGPILATFDTDGVLPHFATDASQQVAYSNTGGGGSVDLVVHAFIEEL